MSVDIKVRNLLDVNAQNSYTSSNLASGVSTLPVKNVNGFEVNSAIQLGKTGEAQTEIAMLSSVSGTALGIAGTLRYAHPIETPVFNIDFDNVILKRSTAGTAGTAVAITNGTIAITPNSFETILSDSSGAASYAYKTAYYNSVTTLESSDSDWITPAGYPMYSLASMRERVKGKLYDAGFFNRDNSVDDWINEWVENLNNAAIQVDQSYALGSTDVAFGTSGLGTITAQDYKEIKRLWVTYDGVTDRRAAHIDITGYFPEDQFSTYHPYYANYGDSTIIIKPADVGGTAKIIYYKLQQRLVNDADELPVSMRAYSKSFVDYALGEAYYLDNKVDRGQIYNGRAESEKFKFIEQMTPRGKDGVVSMDMVLPVYSDQSEFAL